MWKLLLMAAIVAGATPAAAQSVKAGVEAWQRTDYPAAVAIWRPLAGAGNADAAFNLGQAYRLGRGVPLNLAVAHSWFERAARKDHLDAQTTLGLLLFDSGSARRAAWLKTAAERGEPRALLIYGTALFNGDGRRRRRVLAYAYISRAAAQGLGPAKGTLAELANPAARDAQKGVAIAQAEAAGGAAPVKARPKQPRKPPSKAAKPPPASGDGPGQLARAVGAFAKRSSAEALFTKLSAARRSPAGSLYDPGRCGDPAAAGPSKAGKRGGGPAGLVGGRQACFPVPRMTISANPFAARIPWPHNKRRAHYSRACVGDSASAAWRGRQSRDPLPGSSAIVGAVPTANTWLFEPELLTRSISGRVCPSRRRSSVNRAVEHANAMPSRLPAHPVEATCSATGSAKERKPPESAGIPPAPAHRADSVTAPGLGRTRSGGSARCGPSPARQQRDALAQRRREIQLALHGALGDRGDLRLEPGIVGELVDAFLPDDRRIHVGDQQPLFAVRFGLGDQVDAGSSSSASGTALMPVEKRRSAHRPRDPGGELGRGSISRSKPARGRPACHRAVGCYQRAIPLVSSCPNCRSDGERQVGSGAGIAERGNGTIINADSAQLYRDIPCSAPRSQCEIARPSIGFTACSTAPSLGSRALGARRPT